MNSWFTYELRMHGFVPKRALRTELKVDHHPDPTRMYRKSRSKQHCEVLEH